MTLGVLTSFARSDFMKLGFCVKNIFLFLTCVCFFSGCKTNQESYVATIGDEKIPLSEFNVYLYDQQKRFEDLGESDIWETEFDGKKALDIAKENSLTFIQYVKVSLKQAKQMDLSLTEEEQNESLKNVDTLYKELPTSIGISEKDYEKILLDRALFGKVYNEVTKAYQLSETEFNTFFDSYFEKNKNQYGEYEVRLVHTTDKAKAEQCLKEVRDSLRFEDAVSKYSQDENKILKIKQGTYGTDFDNVLFSLSVGDISDVITTQNGFYVVKVENIIEPDKEKLKESIKEYYIIDKKQAAFDEKYNEWQKNIEVTKNTKVWDSIQIIKNNEVN